MIISIKKKKHESNVHKWVGFFFIDNFFLSANFRFCSAESGKKVTWEVDFRFFEIFQYLKSVFESFA